MIKIKPCEIKSFDLLKVFAKRLGYSLTRGGHLKQSHWNGLSFAPNGEVRYMKNGTIICQNATFEAMAILMQLLPSAKDFELQEKCDFYREALKRISKIDLFVSCPEDISTKNLCEPQSIAQAALENEEYDI